MYFFNLPQFGAQPYLIHLTGELTNRAIGLEQGQPTFATVVMSLLVYCQEFVRIMGSGLEMHQFVRVSRILNSYLICDNKSFTYCSTLL